MAGVLQRAQGRRSDRYEERRGRLMGAAELAGRGERQTHRGARRQLGLDRGGSRRQGQAKSQAKGVEVSQAEVLQATRDSVRVLMLIRAYRVRGHLHANLDPLLFYSPSA